MALSPDPSPKKHLQLSNGENSTIDTAKVTSSNRKERRKNWWRKTKTAGRDHKSEDAKPKEDPEEGQRLKLRNRETISKPDSLKYEHNISKGFTSKVMQNLNINTPSKNKKKSRPQRPQDSTSTNTNKRKTSGAQQDSPGSPSKKPKPPPQPEVFDSYKFSLELINGEVNVPKETSGKDSKNKYVLFIGNLPYDITREQLEEHFRKTGGIKSIRIPRDKATDQGRGFAYMEFDGRISHGIALRLHQTTLGGRKINVEFTSIGGGKSEARKEKLREKNRKRKKMKMH
ncbi:RNA-binding protein 34 [Plakobranchus ocellatus]|uniref:RNA-binding protein 34 n=1 Tax=Plakobranchus ocellatus TaxID=259542 RepID=A0AAV3ZZ71_9GAST|nr:RNA-binding protein 34 [Plakobranchus ocellatus]